MKTCMFDIEATNLNADFGRILCACFKEENGRVWTLSQRDWPKLLRDEPWNDSKLVEAILDKLSDFDVWCTYYGSKYDLPFVRTRMFGLKNPKPVSGFHIDLYYRVKYGLRLSRSSLLRIQEHLNLTTKKTPVEAQAWCRASAGDPRPYAQIEHHCRLDVRVLEEVYHATKKYIRAIKKTEL